MNEDHIDFHPLDPTADPAQFERIVRQIGERAEGELMRRRARWTVVGQISLWKRPVLAAAALVALISGAALWRSGDATPSPEPATGFAEALGVPGQLAPWVRGEGTPTPEQLLVALGEGQ